MYFFLGFNPLLNSDSVPGVEPRIDVSDDVPVNFWVYGYHKAPKHPRSISLAWWDISQLCT
jgi:hypothetical protein